MPMTVREGGHDVSALAMALKLVGIARGGSDSWKGSISTRGECRMELTMSMKLSLSVRLSGRGSPPQRAASGSMELDLRSQDLWLS